MSDETPMSTPNGSNQSSHDRPCAERTPEERRQSYRELVTHVLALAIVLSTIFVGLWSLRFLGDGAEMEDSRALLAAMSSLSGVVLGYYFGRVPAEARAAQAQEAMNNAMADRGVMRADMQRMKAQMDRAGTMAADIGDRAAAGHAVETHELRLLRRTLSTP
jgi:hypothetical protein